MKKIAPILLCIALFLSTFYISKAGDTIHVQTFVYGSKQDSTFLFPSDTIRFEKILMKYKLRCVTAAGGAGGLGYPCGEWDYLSYTNLYQPTGVMDSTLYQAPSFVVNSSSPDSLQYNTTPGWTYHPHFQYFMNNTLPTAFDSTIVGTGTAGSDAPFDPNATHSRSQYLWRNAELNASGLTAGNITGIRLNINTANALIMNLKIKLKHTSYDSLNITYYDTTALLTVYNGNTTLHNGWNSFQFLTPFNYNGTSNVLVDVSYDFQGSGITGQVVCSNTGFYSGVYSNDNDRSLFCYGNDYVSVPSQAFANIDSFVTVSFWQYGNPAFQPQDQMTFEGFDSLGQRVINAHLPWSDGSVYWDCGNSFTGSYDRINKAATANQYKGRWNHWAFTKNAATGKMYIYLNGSLWHSGSGLTRLMKGIKQFKIGSQASGNGYFYDGNIDEFSVFNVALDSTTIQNWMFKDITSSHPYYSNLNAYYQFNDNTLVAANDSSLHHFNGHYFGTPEVTFVPGETLFRNFVQTSLRPNVIFEKGIYTQVLDSILVIDSVQNPPMIVTEFLNTSTPLIPTDTLSVFSPYYTYHFNASGIAIDSTLVGPTNTLHLVNTPYYGVPFEVINRFEIGRYITPYGINLDLGTGFTWIYDVSDYRTLLHDSVHLTSGNWQEYMDLSFDMIKGVPPRDILKIENVWNGNFGMGSLPTSIPAKTIAFSPLASQYRLKTRTTGHGQGGTSGCGEFCPKNHYVLVDGTIRYQWTLWDTCSYNPLYPQQNGSGGTWIYNRGGWCPGADVKTYDWELTPFVTPGTSASVDYNADGDPQGNYVFESQLVSYKSPNFALDASIEHVKSPSKMDIYRHNNPICSNPLITIKNTGTTDLTSLKISYGMHGGTPVDYIWNGHLKFLEEEDVRLGEFLGATSTNDTIFEVTISEPNGGVDQYADNNRMLSPFDMKANLPYNLIFEFRTNATTEDSYVIKDAQGNVVFTRNGLLINHTYRDTLYLANGCYEFRLTDTGDDGLQFWNNAAQGAGWMYIRKAITGSPLLKTFIADFGSEIYYQFTVGYFLANEYPKVESKLMVYPNPTPSTLHVESLSSENRNVLVEVFSVLGEKVYQEEKTNTNDAHFEIEMDSFPAGVYFVHAREGDKKTIRKVVVLK